MVSDADKKTVLESLRRGPSIGNLPIEIDTRLPTMTIAKALRELWADGKINREIKASKSGAPISKWSVKNDA